MTATSVQALFPLQTSVALASQLQDNTVIGAKNEEQVGMPTTELQSS
jgi:hypothetical protein